ATRIGWPGLASVMTELLPDVVMAVELVEFTTMAEFFTVIDPFPVALKTPEAEGFSKRSPGVAGDRFMRATARALMGMGSEPKIPLNPRGWSHCTITST